MAEHQLPKLTVRVRFPSSAPENYPLSDALFQNVPAQRRSTAAPSGLHGPTTSGAGRSRQCGQRYDDPPALVEPPDDGARGPSVSHEGMRMTGHRWSWVEWRA
jgi:hypothetical protein